MKARADITVAVSADGRPSLSTPFIVSGDAEADSLLATVLAFQIKHEAGELRHQFQVRSDRATEVWRRKKAGF